MTTIEDPSPLRDQQHRLRQSRDIARDSATDLRRRLAATHWLGNTATRVLGEITKNCADLDRAADELDQAVHQIERHIAWAEQQRSELATLERRIRAWMSANPAGSGAESGKPDASIVGALPPRYHANWRTLASRLRRAGATF